MPYWFWPKHQKCGSQLVRLNDQLGSRVVLGFDMVRSRQTVTDDAGRTPAIASEQEVLLEDGSFCDIGHVFAGLDAHSHPTSVNAPLSIAVVNDNVGAVTWTGDLGSVLAEGIIAGITRGRSLTDPETQAIVNEYASPQDMLGNIDAYAMASAFNVSNTGGRKVAQGFGPALRAGWLQSIKTLASDWPRSDPRVTATPKM